MQYVICLSGLPEEVVNEIKGRPTVRFTESRDRAPIARPVKFPYAYRPGMEDYYLNAIALQIGEVRPTQDVGIGLIYVDYSGYTQRFMQDFYPFSIAMRIEPFYPNSVEKHRRREELIAYVDGLARSVDELRARIGIVRDVLSGQRFSPLTLPLRNFQSNILQKSIRELFLALGSGGDTRASVYAAVEAIAASHPLLRLTDGSHRPYYEDDRGLRFKSPGREKHAMARGVSEGHAHRCFINGRARLGGPIEVSFHYDCEYERGNADGDYLDCHGSETKCARRSHVNIAPNDYVR
jgi:hypothetical protein